MKRTEDRVGPNKRGVYEFAGKILLSDYSETE